MVRILFYFLFRKYHIVITAALIWWQSFLDLAFYEFLGTSRIAQKFNHYFYKQTTTYF